MRHFPRRSTDLWRKTDDGFVVLSDASLELKKYNLDPVGSLIWERCDGATDISEIVREVARECGGNAPPLAVIESDIGAFLSTLREQRLIDWVRPEETVDVLLVMPPPPSVYSTNASRTPEYSSPPLGLCYIASALRAHGRKVAILDLHQAGGRPEDVVDACQRLRPRIVGVSTATPSFASAVRVARYVKAADLDVVTILGGAHPSALPRQCLIASGVDYVCVGEGELAMIEFTAAVLEGRDPGAVPGVGSFVTGVYRFQPRPFVADVDALPVPARDLIDIQSYGRRGAMVSARGCPIGCSFCACASVVGARYRPHGLDRVMAEIDELAGLGIASVDFHDDTFNLHSKRVREFTDRVTVNFPALEWGCFCRARQFSEEQARDMVSAGCRVVQFGVESGNDNVLERIGKKTCRRDVESAVRAASAAGIDQIVCGFIIGYPFDTPESIRETIDFGLHLAGLGATRLTLSLLTPYPGTEMYDRREELGMRLLTDDWEQFTFSRVVQSSPGLSPDFLREAYVDGVLRFLDVAKR